VLVLLPFWTSALIKTFAWIVLLSRTGVVAQGLLATGLAHPPVELLYGRGAVVIAMVHALLPLAILTMLPVMTQIDRELERAAQIMGASGVQIFWRVFFHLSLPGVAAAGLLVFISAIGFFIAPTLIGSPRDTTLAPLIIAQIESMLSWNFAAALAMVLVLSTLTVCAIYELLFGLATISGSGGASSRARGAFGKLGIMLLAAIATSCDALARCVSWLAGGMSLRWLLPTVAWIVLAFLTVPTLVILPMGFTSARFLRFPPPGFSLQWMQTYLGSPVWTAATLRSFGIALIVGALATAIAGLAAYAVAVRSSRWGRVIFGLFLAPIVIPSIVTALGLFYLLAKLSLVATDTGLVIGHTILAMPLVFITLLALFRNYDWQLDRAAATLGADRVRALWRVTIPLLKGGLIAAFLLAFIASFEELTIAIFIGGGLRTTLPKQLWDDMLQQVNPTAAAASVFVLTVVTVLFFLAQWLRRINQRASRP
jgi:putative spermidine/putrescine transport system permease protein